MAPQSNNLAELDRFVTAALREYGVPGASVVVIQDGKEVHLKGYGVREIGKPDPVDPNTVFLMASVTKAFTGSLAGRMVDQGKLDVDRPIFNYLPQFVHSDPYVTRNMTTRDLLAQRTGWPAFSGDLLGQVGWNRAQVLDRVRYFKPQYSLREVATYSNVGFFVAGEVVAAVGGDSWDNLMRRELFQPLDMRRSNTTHASLSVSNTTSYHAKVDGKTVTIPAFNHDVLGPAGSLTSCAADLSHWLQMMVSGGQYNGREVLKPSTLADIFKRSMVSDISFAELPPISENTGFYYGMGVGSYDYAGTQVIEKGGGLPGLRTLVVLVPEKRAAIGILSNMNFTAFPEAIRAKWLAQLLGQSDTEDQKKIKALNDQMAEIFKMPTKPANPKPSPFRNEDLVGVYENDLYGRFTITQQGNRMMVSTGSPMTHGELIHVSSGLYWLQLNEAVSLPSEMHFVVGEDGKALSFENEVYGTFRRVQGR